MARHSPSRFVAHARHEQEVISLPSSASHWKLAARSKDCPWEALVHENGLVFTTQTHPETPHASGDGERLIRNFLLLASFFRELAQ
jgi:GMP synthase-like glutamine amidotransferase